MRVSCFTCQLLLSEAERDSVVEVLFLAICPILHAERSESLQAYAGALLSLKLLKRREPGGANVGS